MRWDDPWAESHLGEVIPVHLLSEVEKFLRTSEIPAARFGREVMRDPLFVFDLRKGREPRVRTVTRVRAYLEAAL
jgi:2,4-dienoyl-CoA reductase-like NADH-dependent reductase (Old Yellow Enzyme family)